MGADSGVLRNKRKMERGAINSLVGSAVRAVPVALVFDSKPSERVRSGILALALYSLGHFFIDLYSSAVGAFQPLLVDRLHFTLTQAGLPGAVMMFSGSFVQPAYGYLSDRFHSRMFSALAPAVAGIFIASLGLARNFLGGAGVALTFKLPRHQFR